MAGRGSVRRHGRTGQTTLDWLLIVGVIAAVAASAAAIAQRVFDEGADVERTDESRRALLLEADILAALYEDEASAAYRHECNPRNHESTASDLVPCDETPPADTEPLDTFPLGHSDHPGPRDECEALDDEDGPYSNVIETAAWTPAGGDPADREGFSQSLVRARCALQVKEASP